MIMFRGKSLLLLFGTIGVFLFFVAKLSRQYIDYSRYEELALQNVIYTKTEYADRGNILDRNYKYVVKNLLSYDLVVLPYEVSTITDTNLICELLSIDQIQWKRRLDNLIVKNGSNRESIFSPYLKPKIRFAIQENLWRLDGFSLKKRPLRNYVYPYGFHVFGYTGEVSQLQVKNKPHMYTSNSYIGKNGIEKYYDLQLRGKDGKTVWLRNSNNQIIEHYDEGERDQISRKGKSLISTIDMDLQILAEQLLENKRGAIVAIQPTTGEVLCLASSPRVNPFSMRKDLRKDYYNSLVFNSNSPLLNRTVQGRYSPGSIFKIIEALLGLQEGVITVNDGYNCSGTYWGCRRPVNCEHKEPEHASNLYKAITYSCNSYFINLLRRIWNEYENNNPKEHPLNRIRESLLSMGVGKKLGIDISEEANGFIPDSSFYNRFYNSTYWNFCTLMSLALGQGELLVTPLQLANFMSIIANKGYYITPHLVKTILNEETKEEETLSFSRNQIMKIDSFAYNVITQAMQSVVTQGTAQSAQIADVTIAGKTGTVENHKVIDGKFVKIRNHAIFSGFAPVDNPQIAFVVIVENAGYGSSTAAPMASLIAERYIKDSLSTQRQKVAQYLMNQNFLPLY